MGSTAVCTEEKSLAAGYGSPYNSDVRSFGSSKGKIGSSSGITENILPELELAVTSTNMEANSFNLQSMTVKSSNYNCSTDIKGLKRPDKTLPCPRCNSLDTKFCYYNNYNVNQPRHFCKGCQRYWTAGGTLRNVAIGAGRRKRKHSLLESETVTEASSVISLDVQDFSGVPVNCKSVGDSLPSKDPTGIGSGAGDLIRKTHPPLPFDASSLVLDSLSSAKVQEGLMHELIRAKQSLASQHSSGLFHSTHDNRERASVFHEFIHSNGVVASGDKRVATCISGQQGYESVDLSKFSKAHMNAQTNRELKDVDSKLVLAMPSERQVSNESVCASSLTTQAASVDACASDGKSDATDSEVSKEGENCNMGGVMASGGLQPAHHVSRQMAAGGCNLSQCKVTGAAPTALSWKGPLENPALGAAWAMLSMPLSWAPSTERDRGLFWGLPWGPTASAVDAAKAALIPDTRALQKPQLEPSTELPENCQTGSDRELDKSGQELPSMPLAWGPSTDRGLLWGLPWTPTASAVDAAKMNTRALHRPQSESPLDMVQKCQLSFNKELEMAGKETGVPSEMRVWVPKTLRIKDVDEAARRSIWSTLGIRDKQGSLVSGKMEVPFQCDTKQVGIAAVKRQNANPAAFSHSHGISGE
ncbi:hypothetical protein L7F22_069201 [Adiantum nelumboides]|nr:hypothetical protein [Adiantum nelumboides]